ncbi:porin [Photobacterium indicum]|uniref:Porin n=1 Tax=Photobacterium indicum TaxID=81447 RepID=A0A2T3L9J5_9GAMM|nr:porin [Photobacterium indicum]PSV47657.1 porin [Photobacterium indicum]
MNMKFIAIAVAAATVSIPVSAATVYQDDNTVFNVGGRAEVRGNISDANKTTTNDSSYKDKSRVRLTVDGKQTYNSDITFVGKYEFELTEKTDGGSDDVAMNTRHLYAGAETSFGDIFYGHQVNAVTYLTDWTDVAETFSGYTNEYNVATADRAKNMLRYATTTSYGLTFQVDGNFNSDSQSDGYGAIVAYELPIGLELGAGYAASDQTHKTDVYILNDTDKSDTYLLAAKYANDGIWLAAMYQGGNISRGLIKDSDFDAVDLYAGYSFGDNTVNMTYNYYSADDITALEIDFIGIEYARYMGNVALFGSYKFNLLDEGEGGDGDNDEDELQLGLRYGF